MRLSDNERAVVARLLTEEAMRLRRAGGATLDGLAEDDMRQLADEVSADGATVTIEHADFCPTVGPKAGE